MPSTIRFMRAIRWARESWAVQRGEPSMHDQVQLGERIRRARAYARMTQGEAGVTLGVTASALSQYESGKRGIDAITLDRMSRLYGVPIRTFFDDAEHITNWEHALRERGAKLSPAGKRGISQLISTIHDYLELYRRTETALPGNVRSPFAALGKSTYLYEDAELRAEQARNHFALGIAPVRDLRGFLEEEGYHTFTIRLGLAESDLSGLFFQHPELGPIVVVNEEHGYARRPFTLAHEFAHGLFHYDRPAVLCRNGDRDHLERFADSFAAAFLVPWDALRARLQDREEARVNSAETVVQLARYFGVSYKVVLARLRRERRLTPALETDTSVKPMAIAMRLGYQLAPYELQPTPLPPEERVPQQFMRLAYLAAQQGTLSTRRVAEMLGITDIELEERLNEAADVEEFLEFAISA